MARGGARTGAGRKAGSVTQRTREIADKAVAEGLTPLEYMLTRLRDEMLDSSERDKMAIAAAPYVHAKLAAVEHKGDMTMTTQTKEQRDAAITAALRADG